MPFSEISGVSEDSLMRSEREDMEKPTIWLHLAVPSFSVTAGLLTETRGRGQKMGVE